MASSSPSAIIKRLLRWANVSRDGDDAGNYPIQQVTYLGKAGDALMWFPYGYHAVVPADTLTFLASMQGNPEARVGIPGSPTLRPRIVSPEVVVFHPPTGSKIHFRANGDIEVTSIGDVKITAAGIASITGTEVQATLGATLKLMNETALSVLATHTHAAGTPMDQTLTVDTHTTTKLRGD